MQGFYVGTVGPSFLIFQWREVCICGEQLTILGYFALYNNGIFVSGKGFLFFIIFTSVFIANTYNNTFEMSS